MKKKFPVIRWIFIILFIALAIGVVFQRQWIFDLVRGLTYQPSSEMINIRKSLDLTERGEFLFNASQPVLNSEEEFNYNCQSNDEESAVLGCYTGQNIYVYNIQEKRLAGIRELTTAHELLHAVYARMSDQEKDNLRTSLEKVYKDNLDTLKEEIEAYDSSEQLEEIYVRSGTEIKNLPDLLEKHFVTIFKDQDKVVSFYDSYITVFRELERELDNLKTEMEKIDADINSKTGEYEKRATEIRAEILEFNNCAERAGCFSSESEFRIRRNQLIAEQNAVNSLYDEIDSLITKYNSLVDKYNNNVLESNHLQDIINSHVKVEGV